MPGSGGGTGENVLRHFTWIETCLESDGTERASAGSGFLLDFHVRGHGQI